MGGAAAGGAAARKGNDLRPLKLLLHRVSDAGLERI